MPRYRITFAKTADMRYIGHLDLYRTWERLIRRAGVPLAYTQGFSPHPRISLASALPLGCTGEAEVIDIWLEKDLPPEQISADLQKASPPGIKIRHSILIDERAPTLQAELEASVFIITLLGNVVDLETAMQKLLSATEILRQRRGKSYDLRPLVMDLQILPVNEQMQQRLSTCMAAREGATGRPDELLEALGIDPLSARVHRTQLIFRQ